MTPKATDQNNCFPNKRIRFNLRVNGDGIKIQSLINNHLRNNIVSTRHLRPCFSKHKLSVDDFSQKTGIKGHRYALI